MAQTVCYIAGGLAGPFAVGLVHQWTGGWAGVGVLFVVMAAFGIAAGWARAARWSSIGPLDQSTKRTQ